MSAIVARTASIGRFSCRMPAAGSQAARVTHTLLFRAAQVTVLASGVCDACVTGCCESGTPRIADVASPVLPCGVAASDAAESCEAGSCCGVAVTEDVAADQAHTDVTAACRCQLEPRQIPPADLQSGGSTSRREIVRSLTSVDAALPVAWLPPLNGQHDGLQTLACAQESAAAIPSRPVRVLYGVWRN